MNKKRRKFVEEYLKCWNASEAARRAEYAHPGQQGHRLLKNVEIQDAIKKRLAETAMEADEVLARLSEQARADVVDFITIDIATGRPIIDLRAAEGKTHLIKSVRETKEGVFIELYNSQSALVQMGKAHGVFEERHIVGLDESTRQFLGKLVALVLPYVPADKIPEFKEKLSKLEEADA